MTIKEWKAKFAELHEQMKKDIDVDELDVHITDEKFVIGNMWPEQGGLKTIINVEVR